MHFMGAPLGLFKLILRLLGLRMFCSRRKVEGGGEREKERKDRTDKPARRRDEESGSGRVLFVQPFYIYSTELIEQ